MDEFEASAEEIREVKGEAIQNKGLVRIDMTKVQTLDFAIKTPGIESPEQALSTAKEYYNYVTEEE